MATNYPGAIDGWEDKIASQPVMAQHMNNLQDAIYQLQLKVGANATSLDTTLDYNVSQLFVASTYLWFYENTAPTGWTIQGSGGDTLVGCANAGSGWYSGTASYCGSWDLDGETQTDSHQHYWTVYSSGHNYTYTAGGTSYPFDNAYFGSLETGKRVKGFIARTRSEDIGDYYDVKVRRWGTHGMTNQDTHDHNFSTGWRPNTAVGIIANYTGP